MYIHPSLKPFVSVRYRRPRFSHPIHTFFTSQNRSDLIRPVQNFVQIFVESGLKNHKKWGECGERKNNKVRLF
jgi:hypothetical protein